MANVLDDLKPKILAMALKRLRSQLAMPNLINRDYNPSQATRGETINIPVPPTVVARDVSPGVTPAAAPDVTENTVPLKLDKWKEAPITFTDKDRVEAIDASVEMAVFAAVDAIAEEVNASIMALYPEVYEYVGTAGTTPFGSNYGDATAARKLLNQNKALLGQRRMVINPDAEENAINLGSFADASFSTDPSVIIEGAIGRKLGFDWAMDQQIPTHTAGSGSGYLVNGTPAIGDTTVPVDTGTGTLVVGDVISFAGHSQTYTVTAAHAGGAGSLSISPALKAAPADNAAVTIRASHAVNLAFHRNAFALAVRAFRPPVSNADVLTMVDDKTGLPLRLEVTRQNKQDNWSLDLLWGVKTIRPDLAVRVAG